MCHMIVIHDENDCENGCPGDSYQTIGPFDTAEDAKKYMQDTHMWGGHVVEHRAPSEK